MIVSPMTRAAFEDSLDRHGPDLDRWPVEIRGKALSLLASDPWAAQEVARAQRLQGLLAPLASRPPLPGPAITRITAALEARRKARSADPVQLLGRPRAALPLTLCAVMVFALGAWSGSGAAIASDTTEVAALVIDDTAPILREETN